LRANFSFERRLLSPRESGFLAFTRVGMGEKRRKERKRERGRSEARIAGRGKQA
jgi:hypothetical protein